MANYFRSAWHHGLEFVVVCFVGAFLNVALHVEPAPRKRKVNGGLDNTQPTTVHGQFSEARSEALAEPSDSSHLGKRLKEEEQTVAQELPELVQSKSQILHIKASLEKIATIRAQDEGQQQLQQRPGITLRQFSQRLPFQLNPTH